MYVSYIAHCIFRAGISRAEIEVVVRGIDAEVNGSALIFDKACLDVGCHPSPISGCIRVGKDQDPLHLSIFRCKSPYHEIVAIQVEFDTIRSDAQPNLF